VWLGSRRPAPTESHRTYCNDSRANALIVGVNAKGNLARWFTLERQLAPRPANLTNHGLAAEGKNWRLRPVV
jgi:hypothetical protein